MIKKLLRHFRLDYQQGFCEVTIYKKRAKLKYQDELLNAQDEAKNDKLGRWR